VADVEQRRLQQLRLDDGRRHLQQRLVREQDGTLGDRADVPGEPQGGEIAQELRIEAAEGTEIAEVLGREAEGPRELQRMLEARRHHEGPRGRQPAGEEAERRRIPHAFSEEGGGHRELVQICEEGGAAQGQRVRVAAIQGDSRSIVHPPPSR
jgi:hypothetical protein